MLKKLESLGIRLDNGIVIAVVSPRHQDGSDPYAAAIVEAALRGRHVLLAAVHKSLLDMGRDVLHAYVGITPEKCELSWEEMKRMMAAADPVSALPLQLFDLGESDEPIKEVLKGSKGKPPPLVALDLRRLRSTPQASVHLPGEDVAQFVAAAQEAGCALLLGLDAESNQPVEGLTNTGCL